MMKNTIRISALLLLMSISCKNRNDEPSGIQEISEIKIDSVSVPSQSMNVGTSATIKTYSSMYQGCESFFKYEYSSEGNTRQIIAKKLKNYAQCDVPKTVTSSFTFAPTYSGIYTFKFKNSTTSDSWIEKTITVE